MRLFPSILTAFVFVSVVGARTQSSSSSSEKDSSSSPQQNHRQYSSLVDNISTGIYSTKTSSNGNANPGSSSSSIGNYGGSSSSSSEIGTNSAKSFGSGSNSVEYGGAAESTNLFSSHSSSSSGGGYGGGSSHHVSGGYPAATHGYPAAASHVSYPASSGGYPASSHNTYPSSSSSASASATTGGLIRPSPSPVGDIDLTQAQPHGPGYTYYYQHYPNGNNVQGNGWGSEGQQDGDEGHLAGLFGGGGAGGGGGLAGLGGLKGLKGLGILAAIGKGIIAIKPFIIIGLLTLIAIPVLLLFLPIPIISVTGGQALLGGRSSTSTQPGLMSYFTQLSEKVLSSEECLERLLCKMPTSPQPYRKKVKSLWSQWGSTLLGQVKSPRLERGLNAYFENSEQKNRNFKCNQKFACSNKFI